MKPHFSNFFCFDFFFKIILVVTSLGSFRRQFFGSKRAQHLLNCKGYVYHLIDSNRDVTQSIGKRRILQFISM